MHASDPQEAVGADSPVVEPVPFDLFESDPRSKRAVTQPRELAFRRDQHQVRMGRECHRRRSTLAHEPLALASARIASPHGAAFDVDPPQAGGTRVPYRALTQPVGYAEWRLDLHSPEPIPPEPRRRLRRQDGVLGRCGWR